VKCLRQARSTREARQRAGIAMSIVSAARSVAGAALRDRPCCHAVARRTPSEVLSAGTSHSSKYRQPDLRGLCAPFYMFGTAHAHRCPPSHFGLSLLVSLTIVTIDQEYDRTPRSPPQRRQGDLITTTQNIRSYHTGGHYAGPYSRRGPCWPAPEMWAHVCLPRRFRSSDWTCYKSTSSLIQS